MATKSNYFNYLLTPIFLYINLVIEKFSSGSKLTKTGLKDFALPTLLKILNNIVDCHLGVTMLSNLV